MASTNYYDTFIAVAPDTNAVRGTVPKETENPSVAFRTFELIHENPYRYTSDDAIFTVYADRSGIPEAGRDAAREEFFARPRPCLRASDLGKKYGWGIHSDSHGRIALYGIESKDYEAYMAGTRRGDGGQPVSVKNAMRSRR